MIIHRMDQYTPEWWDVRKGVPTASCADKILTPTGKLSAQSKGYMYQLLAELMGFGDEPMEPTEWMLRGTELEPEARAYFELDAGRSVQKVGFITNDNATAGCSPDGLISGEIGLEIKCPKASTHLAYLDDGELPPYYRPQVHFSMAVSGLKSWVFMSYFPGIDPLIVPVGWDEYTDKVAAAIDAFTEEFDALKRRRGIAQLEKAA